VRIAVFNVRYSPNLGDGILSICLEGELRASGKNIDVHGYDLAGRVEYGQGAGLRTRANGILDYVPSAFRRRIVALLLGTRVRYAFQRLWREALRSADLVLIGGGNLLSDIDLNFPLKLDGLSRELEGSRLPWGFFAVGVADNWSPMGQRLFRQTFRRSQPDFVVVRDNRSKQIWNGKVDSPDTPSAQVCPDPAVLCCRYLPAPQRLQRKSKILGLNVISPKEIQLHCGTKSSQAGLLPWLLDLASVALNDGYQVVVFSNGNPADDDAVREMEQRWKPRAVRPKFLPRPRTPKELAATIANCDLVAGHRLHLHISAYSYKIPSVGFVWEQKLASFFSSVGRERYLVDIANQSPQEIWALLLNAGTVGWDDERWEAAMTQASAAVNSIVRRYSKESYL
jgi:polysaccharide pyruvyl transferase WcaK-like protein